MNAWKWNYWCAWKVYMFLLLCMVGQFRVDLTLQLKRRVDLCTYIATQETSFFTCWSNFWECISLFYRVLRKPTWSACRVKIFQDIPIVPPILGTWHFTGTGGREGPKTANPNSLRGNVYNNFIATPIRCVHMQNIFELRETIWYEK